MERLKWLSVVLAVGLPVVGASGAQMPGAMPVPANAGATTRPATAPAANADENPFIISDVPMSPKPAIAPDAVVHFSLKEGFLIAQTTLPPSTPQMQKLAGLPNAVHVAVTHRSSETAARGDYYSPDMLQVTYVASDGSNKWIRTSLFTAINHLNLSRDIMANGAEYTIQFIQSAQPSMAGKATSLYVQSLSPDSTEQKQSYSAEHFGAFIRTYPAETTLYLRPMVEVLGPQPHLFVVDDSLGLQRLPRGVRFERRKRGQMLELVKQLNADDFRKRQEATQSLEKMGVAAAAVLASLDRGAMPPEQAARVDAIISRIKPPFEVNTKQLRSDPGFLLDCLLSADAALREAALAQLSKVVGQSVTFDPGPDDTSRVKAVYALRARLLTAAFPATQPAKTQ